MAQDVKNNKKRPARFAAGRLMPDDYGSRA
jgi:hypothetical protein